MKRWLKRTVIGLAAAAGLGGLVVVSGVVPVKASSGHFEITAWFLHFALERSVSTHSIGIDAPPLDDPRLILMGAGHYESGCRFCHGAPGDRPPPVPHAMTPFPPSLSTAAGEYDDEELFYIVRHGVKFTGMPAWPAEGRDDEVWAVVAFLRRLPALEAEGYRRLVRGEPRELAGAPETVTRICARCHGAGGLGRGAGAFPKLAGQRRAYLSNALDAYARGARPSGIMQPIAAMLRPEEIEELAAWYASRPTPAESDGGDRGSRGEAIAARGIPERRIASCADCHGPGHEPRHPAYPILAGQYAEYLEQQLQLFVKGRRGGSKYAQIMETVASHALEPDEIRAVAEYYASLR